MTEQDYYYQQKEQKYQLAWEQLINLFKNFINDLRRNKR